MKAFWLYDISLLNSGASLFANNLEIILSNECMRLISRPLSIWFFGYESYQGLIEKVKVLLIHAIELGGCLHYFCFDDVSAGSEFFLQ
jgi:hypothetical protein